MPLVLSLATFGAGILLYLIHGRLRDALIDITTRAPSFDRGWDQFLAGLMAFCKWQTRTIQTGVLRKYLFTTFATAFLALAGTMAWTNALSLPAMTLDLQIKHWVLALLVFSGLALTVSTRSRIAAIAGLGVVGIGVVGFVARSA